VSKMEKALLALVNNGPLPYRRLMNGRSASAQLTYARLLRNGSIVESGMGTKADPKYVGLPGMVLPQRRLSVRRADVSLMVRSGVPKVEAKNRLAVAASIGEQAVLQLLQEAHERSLQRGEGLAFRFLIEKV
jgi:hypothetical protein